MQRMLANLKACWKDPSAGVDPLAGDFQHWLDSAEELMKNISGEELLGEISITVSDPSLDDNPLVGFSQGFTTLTGYEAKEILGRNCRFLIDPVPKESRVKSERDNARAFCDACQKIVLENASEPAPEDCCCLQVNSRKDGTLFRNMFLMHFVQINGKAYIVGLQHEIPWHFHSGNAFTRPALSMKLGRLRNWLTKALGRLSLDEDGQTFADSSLVIGKETIDLANAKFETNRKYSVSSEPDDELLDGKRTLSSKKTKCAGDPFNPQKEGVGYACKNGLKPKALNQDNFFIIRIDDHFSIYGVFDGHGNYGHDVSNTVKTWLPNILISDPQLETDTLNVLKRAFIQTQMQIEMTQMNADQSGTTATVILHNHTKNMLFVAHVGDSRLVLGKRGLKNDATGPVVCEAVDLTEDHKPHIPEEKNRIENAGGQVFFDEKSNAYRLVASASSAHIYGTAHGCRRYRSVSRCMGDVSLNYDAGMSAVPTLRCHSIDPMTDHFIVVCSHGVWEAISSEDAVRICAEHGPAKAMVAAEALAQTTLTKQSKLDNADKVVAAEALAQTTLTKQSKQQSKLDNADKVVDGITVVVAYLNYDASKEAQGELDSRAGGGYQSQNSVTPEYHVSLV